jgi:hypothetical protein
MIPIATYKKTRTLDFDFVFKPLDKANRANLPPKVKIVYFLALKGAPISKNVLEDCWKSHPEYFEEKPKILRFK